MTTAGSEAAGSSTGTGPWVGSFEVDGIDGAPIRLIQTGRKSFLLGSDLAYTGVTGLENKQIPEEVLAGIRTLGSGFESDLASVPGPTRWFLGEYGVHTPAVLIHDNLIPMTGSLEGMTDQYADRYFRFMLQSLGVRWFKRWIMWAAVALRTRWAAKGIRRLLLAIWILAAAVGMTVFALAVGGGDARWALAAAVAPLPFAALWGKQYGAGIIASLATPWMLPPTVLALLGYLVYLVLEFLFGFVAGSEYRRGTGTYVPDGV